MSGKGTWRWGKGNKRSTPKHTWAFSELSLQLDLSFIFCILWNNEPFSFVLGLSGPFFQTISPQPSLLLPSGTTQLFRNSLSTQKQKPTEFLPEAKSSHHLL